MRKDVEFLAALEVMDYSLLLGIAGGEGREPINTTNVMGDGPGERSSIAEGEDEEAEEAVTAEEADAMEKAFERSSTSHGGSAGAGGDDDDVDADIEDVDLEGVDDDGAADGPKGADDSVVLTKKNEK